MNWKSMLRGVFPTLARMVIPGGPLVVAATEAISKVVLGKADGSDDEITAALAGPEAVEHLAKLRELDLQFQKQAGDLAVQFEQLQVEDRRDARSMQVQTHSRIMPALAVAITGGFFLVAGAMFFVKLPADNKEVIMLMVGALIASFVDVRSFYFGSSASSRAKDNALAQAVGTK